MNFDAYKNDDLLIITPNDIKMNLLKENNDLINIKFMTKEEFINHYLFTWNNQTIDYLITNYQYDIDFCKVILKSLYVIDINKEYKSNKLKDLQNIYRKLVENNLLVFDNLFKDFIKNKKIIIYNYQVLEKYEEKIFKDYERINIEVNNIDKSVSKYETLEEEIVGVCEKIIKLYNDGVSLNNIYISNVNEEYNYLLYKIFNYYNIPININLSSSLYGTNIVKTYLETKKLPGFTNDIVKKLVNVINSLKDVEDSPNYNMFLIDKLKNTNVSNTKYVNAVNVCSDIQVVDDNSYLFVLSFNQDILPKIYKDEDYISDSIKDEVDLYKTYEKNELEKKKVISIISNTKNIYLSYKEKSTFNEYRKSSLIDELDLNIVEEKIDVTNSNLYNEISLAKLLDNYYKYGEENTNLNKLISHYNNLYNTYSNEYKKVLKEDLYKYINFNLLVSFTSINNYYECRFKYYIANILKISPFESNFSTVIGNVFHNIFSVMDNPLFNLDREWENELSKYDLTIKERFLLENLKEDLIKDIEIIKDQDFNTTFNDKLYEEPISIPFNKDIKVDLYGKLDKVLHKNVNGEDLISIIDYKTGSIDKLLDIKNNYYGLSMQLPIYLYLINNSKIYNNPKIVGIYLQKVLNGKVKFDPKKSVSEIVSNDLKLHGYTTDNISRLSEFDKSYEKSNLIHGMGITSSGNFNAYSKVLDDNSFNDLTNYTENKINEAVDNILEGSFDINPVKLGNDIDACKYCKFSDICFNVNKREKELTKIKDLSFLGGDSNEMDS